MNHRTEVDKNKLPEVTKWNQSRTQGTKETEDG